MPVEFTKCKLYRQTQRTVEIKNNKVNKSQQKLFYSPRTVTVQINFWNCPKLKNKQEHCPELKNKQEHNFDFKEQNQGKVTAIPFLYLQQKLK